MKTCSNCGVEKELINFSTVPKNKDGYNGQCRQCCNEKRSPKAHRNPVRRTYYPDEFGESYEDGFG